MNREPQSTFDFFAEGAADINQFRLSNIQLFKWGTFDGVVEFQIPRSGYLFLGPSGSGKSTILDAHAAILTPPKWVDFNVAARQDERHGKDRNLITYIRGAWSQQTGDSGEYVSQYLRSDTTWSAIAETYRDGTGRVVVLAQVFWVRGKSTAAGDVHKRYLVLQREFDVRELQFFADHNFDVRRFKFDLPDAMVKEEFSGYQERFRQLLDIDNERALRLLHKTQSAKNLGDLNTFLRDFMLDAPETFELADNLVAQFQELNEAHKAVVEARRQIETLRPAQTEAIQLDAAKLAKTELEALSVAIDAYSEREKKRLLAVAIHECQVSILGLQAQATEREAATRNALEILQGLQQKRSESGGGRIEQLGKDIQDAESQRDARIGKRSQAEAACQGIGWPYPDNATEFARRTDEARQEVIGAEAWRAEHLEKTVQLRQNLKECEGKFGEIRQEIEAMEKHPSNIPSRLLGIREQMAKTLNIPEDKLPFAGELIEVKEEDSEWRGAIERVLGGFARSLLVADKHYSAVSGYLNEHNIGERLTYLRVIERSTEVRPVGPNSLVGKLKLAHGLYTEWLRDELKAHFNYDCVDSLQAFRNATRAVTREGQVKHNTIRHEKNDRTKVDDQTQWVLGFDNKAKLALFKKQALELVSDREKLRKTLETHTEAGNKQEQRLMHCQTLANLQWVEVDVASMLTRISSLQTQLGNERKAHPDLAALDEQIEKQQKTYDTAQKEQNACSVAIQGAEKELNKLQGNLDELRAELLGFPLSPPQLDNLKRRFDEVPKTLELATLPTVTLQVERGLNKEKEQLEERIHGHIKIIERQFQTFVTNWLAEAGGLDPTMASADDFFAKLKRLEQDGLPEFEERFLRLLREQSDQNLTRLSTQLDQERKAIRDRMDVVNESLETAPFGPGTHLVIDTQDRMLKDVLDFKQSLKGALSYAFSQDKESAEARFEVLNELVKKLSSQETVDRNWRALVLDVRQHVEFVARELDESGLEIEVYRSGAGKSGGQRQKLAATCLAAALRYQLGGHDRELPTFSTVVLDEAFDKADAEFTAMAMNIFKTFGFQMIVATPLKSVMTLEPFIGGACFIHIKDRKYSAAIPIDYDDDTQRLKWKPEDDDGQETAVA
ncbi:ATP-binding protein [Chromobacterium haemolyticum]|uniref:ATP-binding protein n=1 Tax=Chromobacterium haemolyticum TaxID=394935 RepID=A0ABS3GQ97_9NEIS|nr:SbcC/MukB-like Walker B domain-containing protein [Chromobacterium haemolyticum]MBK0415825.1 ATP-binding protein [Chromobacterium haemolyticum]MBO0417226.1 ATP-binding protein [Chromobacterium haemolyticum]MBO0500306.1 ATP-binding protein [Chromobacterium haemolyticum]